MALKAFSCGHKGLGKFCHRCAQADQLLKMSAEEQKRLVPGKYKANPLDFAKYLKSNAKSLKVFEASPAA